jgi:hypothetical protein
VTAIKLTPKQLLDRMRAVTAKLLGYDLEHLTPAQSVRLDRAASIRLMLDDVQGRLLAGLEIDMAKFCAASEALERMLGGDPDAQPSQQHDFTGAREELARFLENRAAAIERRDERLKAEAAAIEASKKSIEGPSETLIQPQCDQGVAPTVLSRNTVETSVPELLPEGSTPPTSNVHHSYVDYSVIESDAARYQRINGGVATPRTQRPPSPATAAYLGTGGALNCGGNPWATRDWSPRRGW